MQALLVSKYPASCMNSEEPSTKRDHVHEVVAMKTRGDDPREVAIMEKVRSQVFASEWARETFASIKVLLETYMRETIARPTDVAFIQKRTQEVLGQVASMLKAQIVEGVEHLSNVPRGKPVLIVSNHFGAYKLWALNPATLGVHIEGYDYMAPFPGYFAALFPVAQRLKDRLLYASNEFPGVFGEVHKAAGFIHLPPLVQGGRTEYLENQTKEKIEEFPDSAFVIFPEGTTSGKPTGKGPYDLNPFKTGAYVIASRLGIPIVPVAQYFNPEQGFQLKVFPPFVPEVTDKEGYERYARENQTVMQAWLDIHSSRG